MPEDGFLFVVLHDHLHITLFPLLCETYLSFWFLGWGHQLPYSIKNRFYFFIVFFYLPLKLFQFMSFQRKQIRR